MNLSEVFDVLAVRFGDANADHYVIEDIMSLMCPDYDPSEFKKYHAVKILKWYNILIQEYMTNTKHIDDAEQMKTEENTENNGEAIIHQEEK